MEALVYRYGLPGLPVSIGLYLIVAFSTDIRYTEFVGIPIVIALSLLLGYFLHQAWMVFFENFNNYKYDSPKREALKAIEDTIIKDVKLKSKIRIHKEHPSRSLYNIWDTFLYSDEMPTELRKKDRAMWNSYHTNMGNAIGLTVGIASFVIALGLKPPEWQIMYLNTSIVFGLVAIVLLLFKARQTRRLAESLEVFWVETFFKEFAKTLASGKVKIDSKRR